ncbi:MAG: ester cyclase [Chitinophagales bacterium]
MKQPSVHTLLIVISFSTTFLLTACGLHEKPGSAKTDQVEANIKMYSYVWDEIINKEKLDMFNDSNFTKDVVMHASPTDIVGIDSARAYYANYLTGFSNISFTIKDVFGQGDKLVKHWNFSGTHTGVFFGIPATGKKVSLDGVTLVRMSNGKIAEERDFFDNYEFMMQLGLIPAEGK